MSHLALVPPKAQQDVTDNRRELGIFLARLTQAHCGKAILTLSDQKFTPEEEATFEEQMEAANRTFWEATVGHDYVEIWYWFDPISLRHRIVLLADYPDGPWGDPSDFYFTYPYALYMQLGLLGRVLDRVERFTLETIRAGLSLIIANLRGKPEPTQAFLDQIDHVSLSEFFASLSEGAGPDEVSLPSEDWDAVLLMVKYFNRIPAVPIPKTARLLGVDERTIRNRLNAAPPTLEGILRRGTTWVTIRSIKKYLYDHYRPTIDFDVWKEIEAELVRMGKSRKLGKPGNL